MNIPAIIKSCITSAVIVFTIPATVATAETCWALPSVSVACLRETPGHASEMGSQVIMGTPLQIIGSENNQWKKVLTPEGYEGYIIDNNLQTLGQNEFNKWRTSERVVVTAIDQTYIYTTTDSPGELERLTDVVNGSVLELNTNSTNDNSEYTAVRLPDGRCGYILTSETAPLEQWSHRQFDTVGAIRMAVALTGTPYLWGGTSPKSMDCSGLTKICHLSQGVILPRNASQQALIGIAVPISDLAQLQPGDLLFFGNPSTKRINHVGISLGAGKFIHCSGRVRSNSLLKGDPDYAWNLTLLKVRRLTQPDLDSMSIHRHPWYFLHNN